MSSQYRIRFLIMGSADAPFVWTRTFYPVMSSQHCILFLAMRLATAGSFRLRVRHLDNEWHRQERNSQWKPWGNAAQYTSPLCTSSVLCLDMIFPKRLRNTIDSAHGVTIMRRPSGDNPKECFRAPKRHVAIGQGCRACMSAGDEIPVTPTQRRGHEPLFPPIIVRPRLSRPWAVPRGCYWGAGHCTEGESAWLCHRAVLLTQSYFLGWDALELLGPRHSAHLTNASVQYKEGRGLLMGTKQRLPVFSLSSRIFVYFHSCFW